MIGNISSTQPEGFAAQYPAVRSVPPPSSAATLPVEDTVHLSSQAQGILSDSNAKQSAVPSAVTLNQIIKEAAGGDISALARLALIG